MSRHSKVIARTDTQTDTHRQYENITFPHMRAVIQTISIRLSGVLKTYQITIVPPDRASNSYACAQQLQ